MALRCLVQIWVVLLCGLNENGLLVQIENRPEKWSVNLMEKRWQIVGVNERSQLQQKYVRIVLSQQQALSLIEELRI